MTQTVWNGIVGEISLHALDPVSVKNVQVFPDLSAHLLQVHVSIANKTGQPVTGTLSLHSPSAAQYIEGKTVKFSSADAEGAFCYQGRDTADPGAQVLSQLGNTTDCLRKAGKSTGDGSDQDPPREPERALRADAFFALITQLHLAGTPDR